MSGYTPTQRVFQSTKIYDTDGVANKTGLGPDRIIDYMALMGGRLG